MKTLFTAVLIITIFSSLNAQWYMAVEDGVSFRKTTVEQIINTDGNPNTIGAVSTKAKTMHVGMFSIGGKLGYEFKPFVIELDGKLNLDMSEMVGIYSGVIVFLNGKNTLRFTPLIGTSLNHYNLDIAGRLQYKHFYMEANRTGKTSFYFIGAKCYIYE